MILNLYPGYEKFDHIEVSFESARYIEAIGKILSEYNGSMLTIDYGHDGAPSDTLRVITIQYNTVKNIYMTFWFTGFQISSASWRVWLAWRMWSHCWCWFWISQAYCQKIWQLATSYLFHSFYLTALLIQVTCYGPISQGSFLKEMQIEARLKVEPLTGRDVMKFKHLKWN